MLIRLQTLQRADLPGRPLAVGLSYVFGTFMCQGTLLPGDCDQGEGVGALVVGLSLNMRKMELLDCTFGFLCGIERQRFWKELC